MADTKISELTQLADGSLASGDFLVVVDTSAVATKKYAVSGLDGRFIGEADVAAKGDMFAATANDAVAVLSVGADGTVLTADSGAATGVAWAAPGSAPVASVNSQTGAVVLDADDIDDAATTNKFATAAQLSKIDGVETGADVTDATNVTAAGALMDSEVTNLAAVKAFDPTDYTAKKSATTQAGTTYTVDADDDDSTVIMTNAAAVAVTIPTGLTVGYRVLIAAAGAGGVTLTTTGNTLIGSAPSVGIAQNEGIYVEVTASNTLLVLGGTA